MSSEIIEAGYAPVAHDALRCEPLFPILAKPLVLVGPMGAGKTTIGTLLAKRLNRPFLDSDHELEACTGVSVATIFEIEGEVAFRDREAQVLAQLCEPGAEIVLSTGGGSILRESTRLLLRERAIVAYLHAAPEVSFERVKRTKDRPLLKTNDPLGKLKALYEMRDPLYRETAHFRVETHRARTAIVIDEILTLIL
ncbi:MAG: shikimate kinase [Burkholderiales bacterium]|nr:MAG: shikimate kinase [Burkholderiales bacterium]